MKLTQKQDDGALARLALRFAAWAERWFPDAFVFAALAVVLVAIAALLNGAPPGVIAKSFGDGFWSLIAFTMQQVMVVVGGYVIASSPPAAALIDRITRLPRGGRSAVAFIAASTMLLSLVNWAISLMFSGLLVRAMARRTEIAMDYRAAAAAAYLGLGGTWALGLSSSAAQLQANAGSLPKGLLDIGGVLPFTETIFLWQSGAMALTLILVSTLIAFWSAPAPGQAVTAAMLGVNLETKTKAPEPRRRPGEWLEYSPLLSIAIALLGFGWIAQEFSRANPVFAISNLNTYNFVLLMIGLLLHWRPRSFLDAATQAVPATTGIIVQFPIYGGIAGIMTGAAALGGHTLATRLADLFTSICTRETFPIVMGVYSALLGFFIPSGGGKWILEAPYVLQTANDLKVHLGWAVQIYNAAEALPNLVNPFFMLMLIGVLGLKARDVVGFTIVQLMFHLPLVLAMLWAFSLTLPYRPPVIP
ncbi:short-chain fatty acid transporter [Methylocapsa palsarum]|uniref:Short-chain fatty acids transporter n=1 Tax=Methylocapsa palsarum TaxID=1612308 RepID=A0A1I4ANI6_9HYPH|nr:TIGR00366 family protein [Methylocapsa palsarum]SFK57780.1 short-chain fatty acids transporter [Methylocapsa palsarum]